MANWGIMATGTIAGKFAKTLQAMEHEGENLVAVASRSYEKAEQFAEIYKNEHTVVKAYSSYEELCEDSNIEIIYVATPNNYHYENVKMCLEHGKHVLCEKPCTLNEEEAEKLFQLAGSKNCFLMEAYWVKHLPLVKQLACLLDGKEIGELKHMRIDFGYISTGERRVRKFQSELGGGALLDIGVYTIGFLNIFMRKAPERIQSEVRMNEFGTDWFSELLCSYDSGITATITTTIGIAMPREAYFYGTEGYIKLPDCQMVEEIQIVKNDGEKKSIREPFDINGFEYQIREASACIKKQLVESNVMTGKDTCEMMKILDGIRDTWDMKFVGEKH